MLAKMA